MFSDRRHLLLAVFRLTTLAAALVEFVFDPYDQSYFPQVAIAVIALAYTSFKLAHPLRWYTRSAFTGAALTVLDLVLCAFLLVVTRVLHTAFGLYSLNPVLAAALLFRPRAAWLTGGVTAAYYTVNFFSFPLTDSLQHLASMLFTYVTAVALAASLPHFINRKAEESLQAQAISRERLRLGREIHDGLCQVIYGLRLELGMLSRDPDGQPRSERLKRLEGLVDQADGEARRSIELLRSCKVDQGLLPQIERSLEHLRSETGISYRLEASKGEPPVDDPVRLELLNICEEAFRNVARHSGARQVTVTIGSPRGRLCVGIADDGCGMADGKLVEGHGLAVMKERAESLGGDFRLVSAPGRGTEILVEVPRDALRTPK